MEKNYDFPELQINSMYLLKQCVLRDLIQIKRLMTERNIINLS